MSDLYHQAIETLKRSTATLEEAKPTESQIQLALASTSLATAVIAAYKTGYSTTPEPVTRPTATETAKAPAADASKPKPSKRRKRYTRYAKPGIGLAHLDEQMLSTIIQGYQYSATRRIVTNKSRVADVAIAVAAMTAHDPSTGATRRTITRRTGVLPQNQVPMMKTLKSWGFVSSVKHSNGHVSYFATAKLQAIANV